MECILKRNHPNSISALILAANSEGGDVSPRCKYLESRVQQLEQELARSEMVAQASIREMQDKFQVMKVLDGFCNFHKCYLPIPYQFP
jgi:hypothetical protein